MSSSPVAGFPAPPADGVLRVVLIGDVVGKPGMRVACDGAAWLRSVLKAQCLVINAENAADGSGLRCKDYRRLMEAGYDAVTLGDHVFRKWEIVEVMNKESNIVRPCNLSDTAAGKTCCVIRAGEIQVAVLSALGRVFMRPCDCPFRALDRELSQLSDDVRVRLVDFHAEATSDMQLMGRYLDGRVSAVLGTHTHVATADEQILPNGTAFQCDVGMTGPHDSILGRKIEAVMEATLDASPTPFQVATGDVRLVGTWFDVDVAVGRSLAIGRLSLKESVLQDYLQQMKSRRALM